MSTHIQKQRYWKGATLTAMLAASSAHAGPSGTPASDATRNSDEPQNVAPVDQGGNTRTSDGLETILVTAEKQTVDLQRAALSVTSVSARTLEQGNVTDPTGLNGYVPGLQINKSGGSERMVSIRGVGSQTPENFFTQPGVSFHMDGVYITNSIALNMGFLDADRVEVLRGPQGTVYGQSSTGGTINLLSKQPVLDTFSGDAEGSFGNHDYLRGRASINVPLGDEVAVRGVVQKTRHQGYAPATSIPGHYDLDDADNLNYKIAGLWAPSDTLSFTLSSQHYKDDTHGGALKALDDPNPDPRAVTQDFPAKFHLEMEIETLAASLALPWATLKSTTSYQDMNHAQSFDSDRSDIAHFGGYDHVATWTTWARTTMEELTLSSNPGGALDWIAGAFYLKSTSGQYVLEYKGKSASDPLPILPRDSTPAALPFNISYENLSSVDRTSWAPFVQATWHLTERLRFTGGARYNYDKYDGWGSDYFGPKNPRNDSANTTTGKAEVDFDLAPTNMVYASWSRGYKPGGINPGSANALVVSGTIEPESVSAFELGSKNRFLDNHLGANLSAFFYDYKNMQYIQEDPIPFSGGIGNVPKARIWGAEAELNYRLLTNRLSLGLNLTTLHGEFPQDYFALDRRLADAAGAAAVATGTIYPWTPAWFAARGSVTTNVRGNTPPNLPSLSGGANASWLQHLGSYGQLTSRVEYLYRGDYEARIFNTAGADRVPSYGQFNVFLEYAPDSAPWRASVTVTNLFDKDGVAGRFVDPYGSGVVSNEYIPPRQALFTFNYAF